MTLARMALAALLGLAPLCLTAPAHAQQAAADPADVVPNELIVGVVPPRSAAAEAANLAPAGAALGYHAALGFYHLRVRPGLPVDQAIAFLRQRPEVLYVEPNHVYHTTATPNDTYYTSQWAPCKVQADQAWCIWVPRQQVVVAVIDTGIDYTHPDLTNKITRDASGNVIGYNDIGSNAVSGNPNDPLDDYGHGTHVAGIIGAQVNNGVGVAGIAGWDGVAGCTDVSTLLMPVKVLDNNGSGTDVTVANGITWATDNGARVINMSLGGPGSSTMQNAVNYALGKGVVVVAAAGNSGSSTPSYPGGYPGVLSVAATDNTDTLTSWSNWGSWVTTAAPGNSIYSTLPTYPSGGNFGTNYGYLSGTSMATPHVAGEAALLLGQNPGLAANQVSTLITTFVDPYNPYLGRTIASGAGRINVLRALQNAGGGSTGGGTTIPAAPTGLTACAGNGQVNLSWNVCSGAATYNVKRATTAGGPYTTVASSQWSAYTDTGLTNGTAYYYVVSAVNSIGESANSAQVGPVTPSVPAVQLLGDPGFENGLTCAPWSASSGVIDNSTYEPAHSGTWKAWLCGWNAAHTDTLTQQVCIPSTITTAKLTFWLHIDTAVSGRKSTTDTLKVSLCSTSGAVLATLATYTNKNAASGYSQQCVDVSAYKGKTVVLSLVGTQTTTAQTSFVVDDFALNVQ